MTVLNGLSEWPSSVCGLSLWTSWLANPLIASMAGFGPHSFLTSKLVLQHSLVGSVEKRGISGGQRKRVNIGMELVAKPSLLFMDEPTSGLDSTAATDILSALRK